MTSSSTTWRSRRSTSVANEPIFSFVSKAFTKEDGESADEIVPVEPWPRGVKNYLTPAGYARLRAEIEQLRSPGEPADPSKKRAAAERLRALLDRLEAAEVIDPQPSEEVRFGAEVTVEDDEGTQRRYRVVGVDEADPARGRVSWRSPLATALMGKRVGDSATLHTPRGDEDLTVVAIDYVSDSERDS